MTSQILANDTLRNIAFPSKQPRSRGSIKKTKLTISIPYKQRLANLAIVLEALTKQTMKRDDFEVIIGAMEYSEEYLTLCKKYTNQLNLISVLSPDEFFIPWARNLAMRQATGQVIVQMDADTLLPPTALENLYNHHFAFGQKICVVGQVVGYGNNNDGCVENVEIQPYEKYVQAFIDLEKSKGKPRDPRFQVAHAIPWAFGWTGFISLPLDVVQKNELYFDETFQGWGIDDLEWSYRICRSGTPIVLCEDVQAIHLPHTRDSEANRKTETQNYRRFLLKWPSPDVELAHAFGDVKANSLYWEFMQDRQKVMDSLQGILGSVRGTIDNKDILLIGVELDGDNQIIDYQVRELFDKQSSLEIFPLIGMALPYSDKEIDQCRILTPIAKFSTLYSNAVYEEVTRVSKTSFVINEDGTSRIQQKAI
jgi:GT2 family glycosyltransferase